MLIKVKYRLKARKDQQRWRGQAYRNGRGRFAVVHLNVHNWRRKKSHRSINWMVRDITGTTTHEIVHALCLTSDWAYACREEKFVKRFERTVVNWTMRT
jgi:hypothetical protein